MRLLSRVASALAATAAVAGIVVGIPTAFVLLIPPLIDRVVPEGMSVVELLLRPDDGTLLMAFLALVGVCAWFVLAVSIVGELVAALAHRSAPRINLPGFGLGRSIASALVAMMLGAGPAMAVPTAAITSTGLIQSDGTADLISVAAARSDPEPTGPVHVVMARDTLWRISETALGDPLRWREIYDLNAGREQADGGRLTEASVLDVGWRLFLPADAREVIRVEPGDTLTGLAAEHLGDPARADDLFAANTATPQPTGGVLADPDLIYPGWALALPATPLPHADPPVPAVPMPEATPPPAEETSTPTVVPSEPDSDADSTLVTPQPTPLPVPDIAASAGAEEAGPGLSIAALGVSSLVVGGMLTALAVRRRRQLRHRPSRHRIAVPADEPGRVEWSAQHAAQTSPTLHLDLALRSLAHPDRGDIPVPVLRSARLTCTDALVTLAESTSLPAPFVALSEHDQWRLDADDPLPVPADEAAGCCAPFPTLVSVATDDDRTLLIDLEQRGVLRIGGEPARCVALLRHIAAELATSHTAEDTEVLLVGLGDELPALNPEQLLVVTDLTTALTEIEHRTASVGAELQRLEITSVVEGRLRDVAADSWLPTVLLVATEPDQDERVRLDALAAADPGSSAVAVVVFDPADAELRIGDDGLLELPDIDDGPWQAAQLTENAGTHLAAILGSTADPPVPVGPAGNPEPWASGMQDDGSLSAPEDVDGSADTGIPEPRQPEPSADPGAARLLATVDHQDPHLDDDLTAWLDTGQPSVPMIAILGEPAVRAPGPFPTARPSWFAEVLVYLALHPLGVTTAKAVTDLWSDGRRISPGTIRHALYGARRWAGQGYGGDPEATFVSGMQNDSSYRLRGHLFDWDLFRRLRKRAQARHAAGHAGAVDDYSAALALIRGPVFSSLRPGGYAWLNNHDQRHDLQIPGFIVDTAHELVDIALAAQDTALARRAAEHARMVDIDAAFDRPLVDLMRIAHAEDNRAELEMYATVLLDARGFDVPEELAPDSFAVLHDLLPAGLRRPRS
ncbi:MULTISPECIES: LysM peptidoglycan-binding domain-containing protein [Pseudonocardia]|uniref:LysM domain/BON superfamily protein n=2 Tax=Pseudonocardia TaxID=1847 RepID=A0A1Y2MVV5_PSEAH|nr:MULTISPECIES: LysM peptidoglycan-binding domain-containing protein [Pseudonocardia]OSY39323.1 LysM domain/BON superfamily protein [Pseudonocardia autotrophica]TDN76455.1 LysM domain-containing protein [Pseudonocardia autotrophica]BBG00451.1 hypothetical protein Pdca_16600 [Pseudonocardia autotrophica]GEC29000.1 hypothetical protein PSA01_60290 [Pseudonocardia saturnea]